MDGARCYIAPGWMQCWALLAAAASIACSEPISAADAARPDARSRQDAAAPMHDASGETVDAAMLDATNGDATALDSGPVLRSDGGPGYNPCPPVGPCRFLPFGDSVTQGTNKSNYRMEVFRLALVARQSITFVGSQTNGPMTIDGVPFPRNHEGHGGFEIDDARGARAYNISRLVDMVMADYQPHIIALMIGTNDVGRNGFTDAAPRLGMLLDRITTAAPDALIVLAQIPPTQDDERNALVEAYNAEMPELVRTRVERGQHIILVDMHAAFTADPEYRTSLLADNLHPNEAGNFLMGRIWYDAVSAFLPYAP